MSASTFSPVLKAIARRVLPAGVRRTLRRWLRGSRDAQQGVPVSYGYEIIEGEVPPELLQGWQDPAIPERQHTAFAPLLRQMYDGKPREDFVAVATAVQMTGLEDPLIIEVGCGSGWNSEVLAHLLKRPVHYIGLDYSPAMTALGKQCYPDVQFVVGDATALPFRKGACDILLSGTVLMHLLGYRQAIQESRRVARKWCILHTVPVVRNRPTTILKKFAYGSPVVEVIFNEGELLELIDSNGMLVRQVLESFCYDLSYISEESALNRTYLCEIM